MIYNNDSDLNKNSLVNMINGIIGGNRVLIIKNGINLFNLIEWENFFIKKLSFTLDRRHYDVKSNLKMSNWWTINYDPDKETTYTHSKTRQPLHNDNAWFIDPAEINLFFMERQSTYGGENTFYPLERLLEDLSKNQPTLLNDLMNIEVVIKKGNIAKHNKTTIINNNAIYWNYYRIEKKNNEIKNMCDTFFKFLEIRENTSSVETYKMDTNDLFCFNDLTLLHGRLQYDGKKKNDRILHQSMWKLND